MTNDVFAGLSELIQAMHARLGSDSDPREPPNTEREAVLAVLNGVLGDHLATTDHPLAASMAFCSAGRTLFLERHALRSRLPGATSRLLVMLHGSCMNDLQWQHDGHDHGEALARELGYTPVYLRYNSGLSVSTNGRILASLMERLCDTWPVPIKRLVTMGHNMGGLVARSAIHHAAQIQRGTLRWPSRVDDLVCLGTPHQGTPQDIADCGVGLLLGAAPYAAPLARLARLRSAGINDLRSGSILNAAAAPAGERGDTSVALPAETRCFAVAASSGTSAGGGTQDSPLGDGLVPVPSALGEHRRSDRRLVFPADRQAVVHDTDHLELLSSEAVYDALRRWLV